VYLQSSEFNGQPIQIRVEDVSGQKGKFNDIRYDQFSGQLKIGFSSKNKHATTNAG
jgi:hypothetical protein